MRFDVVIIGGGAAGLFCAIEAGKRGRKVVVIEHNAQVGRKIIISGGGRCNFTNLQTSPDNFVSQNPHFSRSALARYTPQDFVRLVSKHKIDFYEKKLGQLFCRESSRDIVDLLLKECSKARVRVLTGTSVTQIDRGELFEVMTTAGEIRSESVVMASGGLSFPKVGATDFGYRIALQFGLKIVETRPSLVPMVFSDSGTTSKLAGISIDANVTSAGHAFRENILFTHRGLSGPAILQISNYWKRSDDVLIDLMPGIDVPRLFADQGNNRSSIKSVLGRHLPHRFVSAFLSPDIGEKTVAQIGKKKLAAIAQDLTEWRVRFSKTEGYDKAEVTLGGVSTDELSSQTMECKQVPGLFFIGEVVDVTGWLGGYNFQWAWSSGHAAGQVV